MDNTYSDEELERCTLRNPREVIFLLRDLIKRGERISVLFQEGRQSFLTVLIDISEEKKLLFFDIGGSDETNRVFLKAEQCTFSTFVEGIRIQFSVRNCREMILRGERVFAAPLPRGILRLQRREFFRLRLPTTKPFNCSLRRGSPREEKHALHDISVGGIGILSTKPLEFEQLEILENCWIDLHDNGMINVTLEVRYVNPLESRTGKPIWHLGCKFVKLSPLNETLIQRFMARVEAEQRTLSAG